MAHRAGSVVAVDEDWRGRRGLTFIKRKSSAVTVPGKPLDLKQSHCE
jgi:hypothetical protein